MSLGGNVPRVRGGEVVSPVPRQSDSVKKHKKCSPCSREAGIAGQPDLSYEIASLLRCWGRSSSSESPVWENRWSYLGLLSPGGGGQEAGVRRLEWEPAAEQGKPLADLMVTGSIPDVPGSAESKGPGSWWGTEDGNSSLLSLSPLMHCPGYCLQPLCHIERLKKWLTFTVTAPNHYKNVHTTSAELQRTLLCQRHFSPLQQMQCL